MGRTDYLLKLDGVEGESQDHKHKGELEIDSFSFGAVQTGTHGQGAGGGAGKVSLQDFHFSLPAGKHSPKLFQFCATGEHIKKAVLTVRKAGKEQQEYYKVEFADLLVSNFQCGGHGGSSIPTDQISLNFSKIKFEMKDQKADGSLGAAVTGVYDAKANKAQF